MVRLILHIKSRHIETSAGCCMSDSCPGSQVCTFAPFTPDHVKTGGKPSAVNLWHVHLAISHSKAINYSTTWSHIIYSHLRAYRWPDHAHLICLCGGIKTWRNLKDLLVTSGVQGKHTAFLTASTGTIQIAPRTASANVSLCDDDCLAEMVSRHFGGPPISSISSHLCTKRY